MCERFGVDPGAALEDDYLAHQLRVALLLAHPEPESEEEPVDQFEEARKAREQIREMGG